MYKVGDRVEIVTWDTHPSLRGWPLPPIGSKTHIAEALDCVNSQWLKVIYAGGIGLSNAEGSGSRVTWISSECVKKVNKYERKLPAWF